MTAYESQILELIDSFDTQISKELPSEWAEKYRILTSDVTAFPGKASYDRFPYWREPVNCLSPDHPMRLLTIMGGAQIGKSTNFIETGIGYIIKNYPGNIILTSADKELSEGQMVKKIDQMIEHSGLRHLIRPNTLKKINRRTGDTTKMKEFPGGSLLAQSIKAVDKIRQNSFRYGFFDDFEAAVRAEKQAGDIIDLVLMRFNSFKDLMKVCFISTPEIKQNSLIEPAFLLSDQRYYYMPCPLCGAYISYIWYDKIESTGEKIGVYFEKDDHGHLIESSVGYVCQECKGFFKESYKREMLANGIWKATAKPSRSDWYGYHISGLYAPPGFFDWKHHASQWLKIFPTAGIVRKRSLQVFLNLVLGQTYEEKGKSPKINQLAQNTRPYKIGTVPSKLCEQDGNGRMVMLTCAVDLNGKIDDARIDYEVLAHSETGCTYSIDAGSIGTFQRGLNETERELWTYRNNERTNNVWDILLRDVLQQSYRSDNGRSYQIFIAGVDTGNFSTYANAFIDTNKFQKIPLMLVGIKGDVNKIRKIGADTDTWHLSKEKENLYLLEVNQLKDIIADRIEMVWSEDSGLSQPSGFMNFPEPENGKYTYKGYFMHYESEQKIPKLNADGSEVGYIWQKKHSMVANHFFDCAVYQPALRDIFVENFLKSIKIKDISWGRFCDVIKKAQKI
jgi:phage terminase large subunit GpA-like protein